PRHRGNPAPEFPIDEIAQPSEHIAQGYRCAQPVTELPEFDFVFMANVNGDQSDAYESAVIGHSAQPHKMKTVRKIKRQDNLQRMYYELAEGVEQGIAQRCTDHQADQCPHYVIQQKLYRQADLFALHAIRKPQIHYGKG